MKYFYINNKKFNYTLTKNSIIDFCKNIKLKIPYFCYHNNLALAGNCRMCLVEITNSVKPIVSCTMILTNKMKIYTNSLLVKKARENVLEFLLLNHPLDCPICDQGGECDLQDQSLIFGSFKKRFYNLKRIVIDKNISPIIKMLMTRCIHCTRCVRFSYEILGHNNLLGVFNRGVKSEIGTYVSKTFNSELSGNLIDICPVGALTFKQFSFVNRNWELKNLKSLDFSDGFGLDTQIFINNNSIIKIQPSIENSWISDRTRFSFDGMFSKERILLTSKYNYDKKNMICYWKSLFQNLINILYFKDHLYQHFVTFKLTILLNNQIDIQNLNILCLLTKKYKFIELSKLDKTLLENSDQENSFRINSTKNLTSFNESQFCLFLNLNLRFEGSPLNLKIKQNFFKNNLKIISINSLTNLTFPVLYLGSTLNKIINIIEGNSIITQNLIYYKNPYIVLNSELSKRKDNYNFFELFQLFKNHNFNIYNYNWNGINILNSTLSESGLNYLNKLRSFTYQMYISSNILYLYNIKFNFLNSSLQKYLELKLLNFNCNLKFLVLIEQNFIINSKLNNFKLYNNTFFESSNNNFVNVEGLFKTSPKIISSTLFYSKNDTNIIKFFDFYLNKLTYLHNNNKNNNSLLHFNYVYFNNKNLDLLFVPSSLLTSLNWMYLKNKFCFFYSKNSKFVFKKVKYYKNKLYLWIEDFYLNNKDLYSSYSLIMLECSKSFRKTTNNFLY